MVFTLNKRYKNESDDGSGTLEESKRDIRVWTNISWNLKLEEFFLQQLRFGLPVLIYWP